MTMAHRSLPTLPWLTLLGFQLNAWMRSGDHGVSFDDIYRGLEDGQLWSLLEARMPDVGFTAILFEPVMSHERDAVQHVLRDVAGYLRGSERKKLGVVDGGLALLMALVLEAVQQRRWVPGSD